MTSSAPKEGRDPSHTRQSPRTLAAFRPWGSGQDKRRARGLPPSVASGGDSLCGYGTAWCRVSGTSRRSVENPGRNLVQARCLMSVGLPTEDSPSGLGRTLGKRVGGNPSRVRISHPPPRRPAMLHVRSCSSELMPARACLISWLKCAFCHRSGSRQIGRTRIPEYTSCALSGSFEYL